MAARELFEALRRLERAEEIYAACNPDFPGRETVCGPEKRFLDDTVALANREFKTLLVDLIGEEPFKELIRQVIREELNRDSARFVQGI
jgi:hypothetical protein